MGKWKQYKVGVKESFMWQDDEDKEWSYQIRQRRICKDCDKNQDVKVR